MRYLKNGFAKIDKECDAMESKINARIGRVFVRHQYSEEELRWAADRIESIAEKIRDDIERWETANQLSERIELLYNQMADASHERLSELCCMIERRVPTVWEKVCSVFTRIVEKLLPMISFRFISGFKKTKPLAA
jgi:hypothetical protein